jgi:cytochrome c oxidase assembly protein subunit 15
MRTHTKLASLPGADAARRALRHIDERRVRQLGLITAIAMFLVYTMGTLVTTTNSGHGCGQSWPLCGGKFIPSFAISTAIEFSHRVITGVATILVLAFAAGALWFWRSRLEIRILAPLMVVALFAEAGLGAALVLLPASPLLLAVHFGSSLILLASVLLTAAIVFELGGWDQLRDRPVPPGFRALTFGLALFTYVVGYLGAYMRLRGMELACNQWPVCQSGSFGPGNIAGAALGVAHRLAALVLTAGILWLFLWARRWRAERPDLYRASLFALAVVLAQALVGALVVFSRVAEYSQMLHAGLVALLFCTLGYICLHTLPRPLSARGIATRTRAAGAAAAGS